METLRKDISKRLNEFILDNFENQREFAKAIGTRDSVVSMWVNGQRAPHIKHLAEICKKYDVSLNWLIFGVGNRNLSKCEI